MEEMGMYGLEAVRGQFRGQEESGGARVKCRVGSPHMMVMCSPVFLHCLIIFIF